MPLRKPHRPLPPPPDLTLSSEDTLPADIRPINMVRNKSEAPKDDTIDQALAAVERASEKPLWQHWDGKSVGVYDGLELCVQRVGRIWHWEVKYDGALLLTSRKHEAFLPTGDAARWIAEQMAALISLQWARQRR